MKMADSEMKDGIKTEQNTIPGVLYRRQKQSSEGSLWLITSSVKATRAGGCAFAATARAGSFTGRVTVLGKAAALGLSSAVGRWLKRRVPGVWLWRLVLCVCCVCVCFRRARLDSFGSSRSISIIIIGRSTARPHHRHRHRHQQQYSCAAVFYSSSSSECCVCRERALSSLSFSLSLSLSLDFYFSRTTLPPPP